MARLGGALEFSGSGWGDSRQSYNFLAVAASMMPVMAVASVMMVQRVCWCIREMLAVLVPGAFVGAQRVMIRPRMPMTIRMPPRSFWPEIWGPTAVKPAR